MSQRSLIFSSVCVGCALTVVVLLLIRSWVPGASPSGPRGLGFEEPVGALQFRAFQRLSEDGSVPELALANAIRQKELLLVNQADSNGVHPTRWTWLGPGNIGGRIRAVAIHPTNPSIIWVGGSTGGVWKTVNGGASWAPLDDFLPAMAIGCMVIDKNDPNVLYIGTGEGFAEWPAGTSNSAFVRGAGIWKTTDGGENWFQLGATNTPDFYFVNRLAMNPNDSSTLLAATSTGIYKSTDAGSSWNLMRECIALDVKYHPTDGSKAIAGLHDDGAALTVDGGVTWTLARGLDGHRTELEFFKGNPTIVFASVSEAGFIKVYRSDDGGQSFVLQTTGGGIATYEAYNNALWVDPTNSARLLVGGIDMFRSTDAGASFSSFSGLHPDHHEIIEHPLFNGSTNRQVFFATDGGFYRSNNYATSGVVKLNNNLGITQFYGCVWNPNTNVAFGGTQDNGNIRSTGNPNGWAMVFTGDGGHAAWDPTDDNYFYGEVHWGRIFRSTNGGASSSYIYNSNIRISQAGSSANTNFVTYFSLDPNEPNRMLVGCKALWRSENVKTPLPAKVVWRIIKPSRTTDGDGEGGPHFSGNSPLNISAFAIAQGNPDLIYVGHNDGHIYKTTNGTAVSPAWTRVDDAVGPLPGRWVSKIVIHPMNHNKVYVAFMGWESDNVWRSDDGGASWQNVSGTGLTAIPSAPASALAVHPTEPGWLYVGTDIGLFTSSDDGTTWHTSNDGPSNAPIDELNWSTPSVLLLVSHGRGAYRATIDPSSDLLSPLAYTIQAGLYRSGSLSNLYLSDDRRLIVDADLVQSDFESPVSLLFRTRLSFSNPIELRFGVECAGSVGGLGQRIELFNWQGGQFESLDERQAAQSDTLTQVTVSNAPARYVNPATKEVVARVNVYPLALEGNSAWQARFDQVYFAALR